MITVKETTEPKGIIQSVTLKIIKNIPQTKMQKILAVPIADGAVPKNNDLIVIVE